MTATTIDIDTVTRIDDKAEARRLALGCYQGLIADLEQLTPDEWSSLTVCSPWTVADMVRHMLGAAKAGASNLEMARQQIRGRLRRSRFGGNALDAVNAIQIADHAHLDGAALVGALREAVPAAVAGRLGIPAVIERISVSLDLGGSTAAGMPPRVTLGELGRIIYTRDVWLHRIDIAHALGRSVALEAAIDGRMVEDVIKDWADRHGRPFELRLEGALTSRYARAGGGPSMSIEAVELCWILSGRGEPEPGAPGADLLAHRVLF